MNSTAAPTTVAEEAGMTVTLEVPPTATVTESRPEPEVFEEQPAPSKSMDEFAALLAQSYMWMPLFA
jgi:hypothetical protein